MKYLFSLLFIITFLNVSNAQVAVPVSREFSPKEQAAAKLIDEQLKAFNAHDLERYLDCYAEQVQTFRFPDLLLFDGKAAMKNAYQQYFAKHPAMKCELLNRIVMGNKVIDEERITGLRGQSASIATTIYEIQGGKIVKVFLIYP